MENTESAVRPFYGSDKWMIDRIAASIRKREPAAAQYDRDLCAAFHGRNSYVTSHFPSEKIRAITRYCVAWINMRLAAQSQPMITAQQEDAAYQDVLSGLLWLSIWRPVERPFELRARIFEKLSSMVDLSPYEDGIVPEPRERHVVMIVSDPDRVSREIWPERSVIAPTPGNLAESPFISENPDLAECMSPLDYLSCAAHRHFFRRKDASSAADHRQLLRIPSSLMKGEGDPCTLWAQGRGLGLQFILDMDEDCLPDPHLKYLMHSTTRLIYETREGILMSYMVSNKAFRSL